MIIKSQKCHSLGKKVILNPAPAQVLTEEVLRHVHILTPNETEANLLTGIQLTNVTSAARAAIAPVGKGVKEVVITLEAKGAYVHTNESAALVAVPPVQAVDTTAAGDIFNGAPAVAISEGLSLEKAVESANRAAAISVTRMGAQSSAPYRKEVSEQKLT